MAKTLILCPTHDHSETLFASIASVQAQRETDWHLTVICDGAPSRTLEILTALEKTDPRISHVEHPKGEQLGEAYRDPVLRNSDATYVCHLSDDDLWGAQHLDTMIAGLQEADVYIGASLDLSSGGTWSWNFANSSMPFVRDMARGARPSLPHATLNGLAVRRAAHLGLSPGWAPGPSEVGSDVNMIAKYLNTPGMRIASSAIPTFAKLPSRMERRNFSSLQRLAELTPVLAKINAPNFLENRRHEAVISVPLIRAMAHTNGGSSPDLETALAAIGIRAVAHDDRATIATEAQLMAVPLTQSQRYQIEMAWLLLRVTVVPTEAARLNWLAAQGIAWLLSPYLETLAGTDPDRALAASKALEQDGGHPEIALAFQTRTYILQSRWLEAKQALEVAERDYRENGWLAEMQAWYRHGTTEAGNQP